MVATASTAGNRAAAAAITAAPPSECPISTVGWAQWAPSQSAAATMSSILLVKVVSAKSRRNCPTR